MLQLGAHANGLGHGLGLGPAVRRLRAGGRLRPPAPGAAGYRAAGAYADPSAACAFAAACDGQDVVLLRVRSGMVAGPDPYCGTPCPTDRTPPLPLLRGWDLVGPCTLPQAPPEGFAALMRILRSPPALLNGCTLPLEHVTVSTPLFAGKLELGRRLGCGGSSDVYACWLPGDPPPAVAKLARAGTAAVRALFEAEEATLLSLSASAASADEAPREQWR